MKRYELMALLDQLEFEARATWALPFVEGLNLPNMPEHQNVSPEMANELALNLASLCDTAERILESLEVDGLFPEGGA